MPIRQFRKDSKKGGFDTWHLSDAEMLLNPLSFQAVGKTRGWRVVGNTEKDNDHNDQSYYEMKDFVGILHDGFTIEDALLALENKDV